MTNPILLLVLLQLLHTGKSRPGVAGIEEDDSLSVEDGECLAAAHVDGNGACEHGV